MLLECEQEVWLNSLFTQGKWYELKDVVLAARYIKWTKCASFPPPSLHTMEDIAFWGTVTYKQKRVVATFGPDVLSLEVCNFNDLEYGSPLWWPSKPLPLMWLDPKFALKFFKKYSKKHHKLQVNIYATIRFQNCVGLYRFANRSWGKDDEPVIEQNGCISIYWGDSVMESPVPELEMYFFEPDALDEDWLEEWDNGDETERTASVKNLATKEIQLGHGWCATRSAVLSLLTKQLVIASRI